MVDPLVDGRYAPDNEEPLLDPDFGLDEDYEAEQAYNNYEEETNSI